MPRFVAILTYAGLLPLLICAVLPYTGIAALPVLGPYNTIAASYAVMIAGFMAGTHWGIGLTQYRTNGQGLFFVSTALLLLAWLGWLVLPVLWVLGGLIPVFALLLVIDHRLYMLSVIQPGYYTLRLHVTGLVILLLILIAYQTWLNVP